MPQVLDMLHKPTIDRCIEVLEEGGNVHRWLELWRADGREVDTALAIGIYHEALQDARCALEKLKTYSPQN